MKKRRLVVAGIFICLLSFTDLISETHIINFGGTLGNSYSPANLQVAVNDTIEWQGSFSFHPMSSTTIPPGADPWNVTSGTNFRYAVKVAGDYNYRCDAHFQAGMVGSFTASGTTSVNRQLSAVPSIFSLEQNYPNPFNPVTKIKFSISEERQVNLRIYNVLGKVVTDLVDEPLAAGIYEVEFNASDLELPSGIYIYQLKSGNNVATKKFTVLK